jgi:3-oxoacid CoA-transferase subunit A
MDKEQAKKELLEMLEAGKEGPFYTLDEVDAHIREILHPRNSVFMTGDTHGKFDHVIEFCHRHEVQSENTFIILGDAGLNYYGDRRDALQKEELSHIPITFFCIHGNHEMRPNEHLGYELREYHGGKVWVEPAYPNIAFAVDGEVYDFCGHSCIVIGGAYSVDKYYRLARGWSWFPDEQPSDEIKAKVERVLEQRDWKIDIVLSHTCPLRYEPTEVFLSMVDQSTVDKSTEQWLESIENRLSYERWYCGHYHTDKKIDKLQFLFHDFTMIPHTLSIAEEQAMIQRIEHQAEIVEALGLLDDTHQERGE